MRTSERPETAAPQARPNASRSPPPGSRASRPHRAAGPPVCPSGQRRTSRPRRHLQLAGAPFLGSRASRPPRAAGPANSDSRAMPGRTHRGAHPGSRASRPHRAAGPANSDSRAMPGRTHRRAHPWDRGRPARTGPQARPTATAAPCPVERIAEPTPGIAGVPPAPAEGPPVCPGGQGAPRARASRQAEHCMRRPGPLSRGRFSPARGDPDTASLIRTRSATPCRRRVRSAARSACRWAAQGVSCIRARPRASVSATAPALCA